MEAINKKVEINSIVAENIIFLLKKEGLSRKKVCSDLDIKYTTFCDWINGRIVPKYHNLEKLGEYFGVEVVDFFEPLDAESKMLTARRLTANSSGVIGEGKVLDMEAIREMSDDQIKELLSLGYVFRHKTYEERLSESGGVAQTYKFDWGEPKGREMF